jgi:hypothetical protein
MIGQLLAEAAAAAGGNGGDMNYVTTGAIGLVMSAIVGVITYSKGRATRSVTIEKQPVEIALQREYVTRSEFAEFKGELKADVREMRGAYDKLIMLIDERDQKLSNLIESVAKGAFEGRRRIHEEVNAQGKQLAGIEARTDVSKSIGKLGGALMQAIKKTNQPQA